MPNSNILVTNPIVQKFNFTESSGRLFIAVLILALIGGISTGYYLSSTNKNGLSRGGIPLPGDSAKNPQLDNRTFRDFADGKIVKKPEKGRSTDYSEGTHLLIREGAVPVALTSSVVDLSLYEDKQVKVHGETQKALKEGWLMDVGRVEEK